MKSWLSGLRTRKEEPPSPPLADASQRADELIAAGQQAEDAGRPAEALGFYRQAVEANPGSARAHLNLGNAQKLLGDAGAAQISYRRAVEIDPTYAAAHLNLGNALLVEKHFPDAERSYREALRLRPDWTEALAGLGCVLEELKRVDEAVETYRHVLALDPDHAVGANLGDLLIRAGAFKAAREFLRARLRRSPNDPALKKPLVDLEWDAGRLHECVKLAREIMESNPELPVAHGILVFRMICLPDISAAEILSAHRRYGQLLESRTWALPVSGIQSDPERRLRVGYVSPDFRQHPVASFIAPVLKHHRRENVEIFCYYIHDGEDDVTAQLKTRADEWRSAA